ncbi:uncharacterized protein JCM15063_002103 [Sporobolomyces koalae]|uniref:uncharacterized protein n=1 Tax=Sporobolomyces koalae TaxID=500713 RepID=UPI0031816BFC
MRMDIKANIALRDVVQAPVGPETVIENRAEIERLKKVVRQLEAMIAEQEAERAACLPPTPPYETFPLYFGGNLSQAADDYFARLNEGGSSHGSDIPVSPRNTRFRDPYVVPQIVPQLPNPEISSHPWSMHARGSTWPENETVLPPPHRAQNLDSYFPLPLSQPIPISTGQQDQLAQFAHRFDHHHRQSTLPNLSSFKDRTSSFKIFDTRSSIYPFSEPDSDVHMAQSVPQNVPVENQVQAQVSEEGWLGMGQLDGPVIV